MYEEVRVIGSKMSRFRTKNLKPTLLESVLDFWNWELNGSTLKRV